jgi:inosine/xanthosine triphosphatase
LKVAVASHNPVKTGATERAFALVFPDETLELMPVSVDSGVSDQPVSDDETRRGARNRAMAARAAAPDASYWVGLEGGVDTVDGQLMAFAWMAVQSADGRIGEARSATLPLPPAVKTLVDSGMELGAANDMVFSTVNSKQGGGAFGLLTDGLYTRESIYTQTLVIALIPLVNSLYSQR